MSRALMRNGSLGETKDNKELLGRSLSIGLQRRKRCLFCFVFFFYLVESFKIISNIHFNCLCKNFLQEINLSSKLATPPHSFCMRSIAQNAPRRYNCSSLTIQQTLPVLQDFIWSCNDVQIKRLGRTSAKLRNLIKPEEEERYAC